MYTWFKDCRTAEQGKKLYHDLVKRFHTDNGATDEETIKRINAEFSEWWKTHKNLHYSEEKHSEYTKETSETAEEFIEIIRKLSALSGVVVEICGSWLWISGNTYPYRDQLHSFNCYWSKQKHMWYWAGDDFQRSNRRTGKSMAYIRSTYGSEKVHFDSAPLLN